jgi:hypothetical protein
MARALCLAKSDQSEKMRAVFGMVFGLFVAVKQAIL